jgi:hypothetical protein
MPVPDRFNPQIDRDILSEHTEVMRLQPFKSNRPNDGMFSSPAMPALSTLVPERSSNVNA